MEMNTWRQNISHMVRVHGIEKKDLTIGKYQKIRLMHVDRRWANDRFYPFFTFDRNIKQRLLFLPKMLLLQIKIEKTIIS